MSISNSISRNCCTLPSFHHQGLEKKWVVNNNAGLVSCCNQSQRVRISHLNFKTPFSWAPLDHGVRYKAHCTSDSQSHSAQREDSVEMEDTKQERSWSTTKVLEQLKKYGISGILSYGLLNTAYYLTTFLTVWFYFSPAPGKMGYLAAVSRFLKVMAMVWAGSQVTKLFRAAGALALAPVVDRGLSWFTVKYKFNSRAKAFFTIVGFCFGLAFVMFLIVTLLSA